MSVELMDHWKVVLLLERAAQALVLTDEQGRWLWVNQATVELLGHSHATLVGSNGSDLLPDWPVQSNATLIQTVYRRPDGVQRHLWIERLLLALEYPYRLFAIYVLPPRHTCSTQTCTEGLYYRTLFDLLPVGVAIADATGRIVAANPASELILGVELPVILRSRLDDPGLCSLPAEERPVVQAWKNRQIITNRLISFTRPDGCERWISVNAAPLPNGGVITAYVDVTEQEQTKIALRQNQEKFQRIADMFPGVIYTVIEDENGPQTYEYLSPGFERIHELKIEQVYQNPALVYAQIHPDDRANYQQGVRAAIAENKLFQHQWRILTPDGQVKWLQGCSQPERLDNGQIRWHGIALDITDCKIAGLALQRQMAKERSLRRVMHAIRSSLDLEEIFTIAATTISREFQLEVHIVEYRAQEQCWRFRVACAKNGEIFSPAITEIPDVNNPFAAELKAQHIVQVDDTNTILDPINQEIREYFPGAWLLVPIVVNSQVWGSLSLMRLGEDAHPWNPDEISLAQQLSQHLGLAIEQAQMHIQLQASQQELKWILENSPVVTVKLRLFPNYKVVCDYISPQCERLVGYRPEEFIADPNLFRRCVWPEDLRNVILATYDRIYQGETDHQIFYRFRHRNGHIVWIQEDIHVQPKGPEPYWLLMISTTDVTNLYSARAQIEELAKLNRMKDDFVSTVSHELRTPLSNIRMATRMIELALKRRGLLDENPDDPLVKYLEILKQQTQQEVNLINDLLDLSRLQSNNYHLTPVPVNLTTFLPPLVAPFRERAAQNQQTLQLELADDLAPVLAHIPYLERIVNELLSNACKYTPAGETITLRVNQNQQGVYLQVINTGVEIPESEQAKVFERFYRLPQHDRWKHGGTGLGLPLVKELTERMGGTITLQSRNNQVCFTVQFSDSRFASTDQQNAYLPGRG